MDDKHDGEAEPASIEQKRELIRSHLELLARFEIGHEDIASRFESLRKRALEVGGEDDPKLLAEFDSLGSDIEKLVITETNVEISSTMATVRKAPSYIRLKDEALLINEASSAMAGGDYYQALEQAFRAREAVEEKKNEYKTILKSVQVCEVKVKGFRKDDIYEPAIDHTLQEAKDALKGGDFDEAIRKVNETYQKLEQMKVPVLDQYRKKAEVAMEEIRAAFEELRSSGCDVQDYSTIMDEASTYLEDGENKDDFEKVVKYAEAARAEASRSMRRMQARIEEGKKLGPRYAKVKQELDEAQQWFFIPEIRMLMDRVSEHMVNNEMDKVNDVLGSIEKELEGLGSATLPKLAGEFFVEEGVARMRLVNFGTVSAVNIDASISGVDVGIPDAPMDIRPGDVREVELALPSPAASLKAGAPVELTMVCTVGPHSDKHTLSGRASLLRSPSGGLTTTSLVLEENTGAIFGQVRSEDPDARVSYEGNVTFTDSFPDNICPVCNREVAGDAPRVTCVCRQQFHMGCVSSIRFCPDCGLELVHG